VGLSTPLTESERSRLIEMAWEDRTPFEMIRLQYGLTEASVIDFMRSNMKKSSFKMWRKRMKGRLTKHLALQGCSVISGESLRQHSLTKKSTTTMIRTLK
jgi:uncharacterized protein (TIGR03643 family)